MSNNSTTRSSGSTAVDAEKPMTNSDSDHRTGPPPLTFHFKWRNPLLYFSFLVLCNVVLPCLLFYPLIHLTHLQVRDVVGISSSALGISSCFDQPFRLYKLIRFRSNYAPLHDEIWWHFDVFMWFSVIAVGVFAIPLIVGPTVPVYNLFLMAFPLLALPAGVLLLLTVIPYRFTIPPPKWISRSYDSKTSEEWSTPKARRKWKPGVYYIISDLAAVDFNYGRAYREQLLLRYDSSPLFQKHLHYQTVYWVIAPIVLTGVIAGVTWGTSFNVAFGLVLGIFFAWIIVGGVGSYFLAQWWLRREWEAWETGKGNEKSATRAVETV
ncbi:hypothetical protein L218DRAFT_1081975 [Marasmius fiardii PR-910]|nr:hypothetical protein L218DRAFT_1081975 [Marasmius fiardii PR-910]